MLPRSRVLGETSEGEAAIGVPTADDIQQTMPRKVEGVGPLVIVGEPQPTEVDVGTTCVGGASEGYAVVNAVIVDVGTPLEDDGDTVVPPEIPLSFRLAEASMDADITAPRFPTGLLKARRAKDGGPTHLSLGCEVRVRARREAPREDGVIRTLIRRAPIRGALRDTLFRPIEMYRVLGRSPIRSPTQVNPVGATGEVSRRTTMAREVTRLRKAHQVVSRVEESMTGLRTLP